MFTSVIANRYFEVLLRWLETRHRGAAGVAGSQPVRRHHALPNAWRVTHWPARSGPWWSGRRRQDRLRPPGARRITWLHLAFPGDLSGASEAAPAPGSAAASGPAPPAADREGAGQ